MRLWSIHPRLLDARGLVALWREGLLAQNVLQGRTRGYTHHPQLVRFRETGNPVGAMAVYLKGVLDEADRRGYHFDATKIPGEGFRGRMEVTHGQLAYEFRHLMGKLKKRAPDLYDGMKGLEKIEAHPVFVPVSGGVAEWEVVK